jgi:hypothetical protein
MQQAKRLGHLVLLQSERLLLAIPSSFDVWNDSGSRLASVATEVRIEVSTKTRPD